MDNSVVIVKNLSKSFGTIKAVDDISFELKKGTRFGFLGLNGAGKTTTINLIIGLLNPDNGSINVLGYDVAKQPIEVKKRIGVLSEDLNLYERLTVFEFLTFVGKIYGLDKKTIDFRTKELLDLLALTDKKNNLIIDLSHGMKKKVALAAALIHDPEILFLDEPFTGIDPVSSGSIKNVLEHLSQKGITIFFSSHVLEVVEKLCTEVAIINKGKIIGKGPLKDLRKKAKTKEGSSLEEVFLKLVEIQPSEGILSWKK